jgi:hypothetical protein
MSEDAIAVARRRMRARDRVLELDPVVVQPSADPSVGIHILCWKRDYREAVWALASLLSFLDPGPSVTIHTDSGMPPGAVELLAAHVVGATIWSADEADDQMEPRLAADGLHRLRSFRQHDPLGRKLVDLVLMGSSSTIVYLDSDVLIHAKPTELTSVGEDGDGDGQALRYLKDTEQSTVFTAEAARSMGLTMTPTLNSGLLRIPRASIDLERFDHWLGIDALAAGGFFTEQTLWALMAATINSVPLPSSYTLADAPSAKGGHPGDSDPVAVHYTSPSRALLYDEGIPLLLDGGLEDRLRSRALAVRSESPVV